MGDEGDIWRKVKEENAKIKERNLDAIGPVLKKWGAREVTYYQFRLGEFDIYPMRGRYLHRPKNKWGRFKSTEELKSIIWPNK